MPLIVGNILNYFSRMLRGSVGSSLSLGLLAHGAAEQFGQGGIEGCACLLFNLLESLRDGKCCSLRLFGRQLVEHLGNTDNASEWGYAFFFQAKGVARSIPSLVMESDNLHGVGW